MKIRELMTATGCDYVHFRSWKARGLLPGAQWGEGYGSTYTDDHRERLSLLVRLHRAGVAVKQASRAIENDIGAARVAAAMLEKALP